MDANVPDTLRDEDLREVELSEVLGCFGFFGYGGGWNHVKQVNPGETRKLWGANMKDSYCRRCPRVDACHTKHVERARTIFPKCMVEFERMTREAPVDVVMLAWLDHFKHEDPLTKLCISNTRDGILAAKEGRHHWHGPHTLPFPLKKS